MTGLRSELEALLDGVRRGEVDPAAALERFAELPYRDLGFARVDLHREVRQGAPEAVLGEGKTPEQVRRIVTALLEGGAGSVLVTRADEATRAAVLEVAPDALEDAVARAAWIERNVPEARGLVVIVSAGTSDGPVLHEARIRAELLGAEVVVHEDVGVAGIHRLGSVLPDLARADCVVVVAGMDGGARERRRRARGGAGDRRADERRVRSGRGWSHCAERDAVLVRGRARGRRDRRRVRSRHDRGEDRPHRVARVTQHLHLDCVGGIAGDMLLAALLDAGAEVESLQEVPAALGIGPVEIVVSRVRRQAVSALHVDVRPPPSPPSRTWRTMRELIEAAGLDERVRQRSLAVFARLAAAEAAVHGGPVDDVHFHELGGVDALVDVCGAAVLLENLGVARVSCSPLPYTHGVIRAAHGPLPVPAPATVELLRGARISGVDSEKELVTPTGAALAVELAGWFGPPPGLTIERIGYGAGTDDPPERTNVLRVIVGESSEEAPEVILLETNLDDLSPELVPDAVERCFAAGALDVWTMPAQMKKGRPGLVLSVLARPDAERAVARVMLEETSALGVRVQRLRRYELEREERVVDVTGGAVRVKLGFLDGRLVNVAPEHDDCAELARRTGRPVKDVMAEALAAARTIAS